MKTIEVYNRYRSSEATAKLIGWKNNGFIIEFKGTFCLSCGVRDYFEDFIYELEDLNEDITADIKKTEQTGPQSFRVHYIVEDSFHGAELDKYTLFRAFLHQEGLSSKDYFASYACTKGVITFHFRTWLLERKPKLFSSNNIRFNYLLV